MNRTPVAIAFVMLLMAGCASAPLFTVVTSPSGADILVDGKQAGKTPATIKVKFSENSQMVMEDKIIAVKLPGYKEKKEMISYHEGNTTLKFNLEPDHLESAPSAAEVVSKSSATSVPANQAGVKTDVVSEPSVSTNQVLSTVVKADVVSQQSATTGL